MLRRCFALIALALPACSPSLPAAAPTGPETAAAAPRDDSGARDAELAKQNLQSQECVREAIAELGGTILDRETPWLVNTLLTELTWPQIEQLAHHPEVQAISARHGGEPPP